MSNKPETLRIRPFARLLTMLGEQLIKNERIALAELIKNSYDADADWARIEFQDFSESCVKRKGSKIVIEDNGIGMSEAVIKKAWMNPATPHKVRKNSAERLTPIKGRVVQGEKGIGRFAILKLGRVITIVTRPKGGDEEFVIRFDFSEYDDDFTEKNGEPSDLYLDSISVTLERRKPQTFDGRQNIQKKVTGKHGTRIEISDLKGAWSRNKIKDLTTDTLKLQSIFTRLFEDKSEPKSSRFEVAIVLNGTEVDYQERALDKLRILLEHSAVLRVEDGEFDDESLEFRFTLNGTEFNISFDELRKDRWLKDRFGAAGDKKKTNPDCGPFGFSFYVFDLKAPIESKHHITKDEGDLIKEHRVYLYRDGVRVYPYGEKDDDWLGTDILRGKFSASAFLSNDQVVGCVDITHKSNPKLKDKTSREGLIDTDQATEDFVTVIRSFLSYLRNDHYKKYRNLIARQRREKALREGKPDQAIRPLYSHLERKGDEKAIKLTKTLENAYKLERGVLTQRAETTEELAAVGIAVETASHDLMLMMDKIVGELDGLISSSLALDSAEAETLQKIRGMVAFVDHRMRDLQAVFKSSKQRRKPIRINEVVDKVHKIYQSALKPQNIDVNIVKIGPPLVVKCTDAVIMQLLINLFDNSLYWLQQVSAKNREITITLDGSDNRMIFSDSGPGVPKGDIPFIFDAWYSGKGDQGRGLGLYIAKQLLDRFDYTLGIAEFSSDRILGGANFVMEFSTDND